MIRTRRALNEAELRAAEAEREASRSAAESSLLRSALDALPIGVVVSDPAAAARVRNQRALSLATGTGSGAVLGAEVAELLDQAHSGEVAERLLELHGPPPRTFMLRAHPLAAGGGTAPAVLTIEDLTDFHRLEAMRRDFVANVSHELRTPIGALGVLAEALAGELDGGVVERLAGRVSVEVERAGRIVDDLLDLSRIETERGAERVPVAVDAVVRGAAERVEPAVRQREVTVHTSGLDPTATVLGSEHQLVSALANLIDNAVKYSAPGSRVEVEVRSGGDWTDIAVRDHGIGIPARDLDRVFERFYRVDPARSRDTGGTGLGLAIVRHVARNHGGDVLVESREGEGSTFTLHLPTWD